MTNRKKKSNRKRIKQSNESNNKLWFNNESNSDKANTTQQSNTTQNLNVEGYNSSKRKFNQSQYSIDSSFNNKPTGSDSNNKPTGGDFNQYAGYLSQGANIGTKAMNEPYTREEKARYKKARAGEEKANKTMDTIVNVGKSIPNLGGFFQLGDSMNTMLKKAGRNADSQAKADTANFFAGAFSPSDSWGYTMDKLSDPSVSTGDKIGNSLLQIFSPMTQSVKAGREGRKAARTQRYNNRKPKFTSNPHGNFKYGGRINDIPKFKHGGTIEYNKGGSYNPDKENLVKFKGSKHEKGGIPLDINGDDKPEIEVEGEETAYKGYVFSNDKKDMRLPKDGNIPKSWQGKTPAKVSEKIFNKYKNKAETNTREKTKKMEINKLMKLNEILKAKSQAEEEETEKVPEFKKGGDSKSKKKNNKSDSKSKNKYRSEFNDDIGYHPNTREPVNMDIIDAMRNSKEVKSEEITNMLNRWKLQAKKRGMTLEEFLEKYPPSQKGTKKLKRMDKEKLDNHLRYEHLPRMEKGGQSKYHAVKASETEGDSPKYPINNCNDCKDAWKLRNHGDNLKVDQSTLESRIKSKCKDLGCGDPSSDKEEKRYGGKINEIVLPKFKSGGNLPKYFVGGSFSDNYMTEENHPEKNDSSNESENIKRTSIGRSDLESLDYTFQKMGEPMYLDNIPPSNTSKKYGDQRSLSEVGKEELLNEEAKNNNINTVDSSSDKNDQEESKDDSNQPFLTEESAIGLGAAGAQTGLTLAEHFINKNKYPNEQVMDEELGDSTRTLSESINDIARGKETTLSQNRLAFNKLKEQTRNQSTSPSIQNSRLQSAYNDLYRNQTKIGLNYDKAEAQAKQQLAQNQLNINQLEAQDRIRVRNANQKDLAQLFTNLGKDVKTFSQQVFDAKTRRGQLAMLNQQVPNYEFKYEDGRINAEYKGKTKQS